MYQVCDLVSVSACYRLFLSKNGYLYERVCTNIVYTTFCKNMETVFENIVIVVCATIFNDSP